MNEKYDELDQVFDRAIETLRKAELDPQAEDEATGRVWQQLAPEMARLSRSAPDSRRIRDCSDFQSLIPAYLESDRLSDARTLLLEDHVRECVPCRRALKQAREANVKVRPGASREGRRSAWGWRIAAVAAVFLILIGLNVQTDFFSIQAGGLIKIEKIEGEVFQVIDNETIPVRAGDELRFEDSGSLRTAKGARAVLRLEDESMVEMNERAVLSVQNRRPFWSRDRGDAVIDLDRGEIIVEASPQGSGHLFVATEDCRVAVTGTVFAVNHGTKGSRVSVVEGEVHVAHSGETDVLEPGQQTTTSPAVRKVPVEDEIAWSAEAQRYVALLGELGRVAREIEDVVEGPGVRYSTTLLDRAPENTVVYIGIPNVSATLSQAYDLLKVKIEDNDVLRQWWDESMASSGADSELQQIMDKIRDYGEQLGEEVAVTLQLDSEGDVAAPLVLSTLARPHAFRDFIESELESLDPEQRPDVVILEGDLPASGPEGDALYLWIHDDFIAAGPRYEPIRNFERALVAGSGSAFQDSAFHRRMDDLYRDGVDWVVGVDLETMLRAGSRDHRDAAQRRTDSLERLGIMDLQHMIAERKELAERSESRVILTFDEPRKGLASWLAEPAPNGALDFISADAAVAAGFVMKEPTAIVEELFELLQSADSDFDRCLHEFQRDNGIDIRQDVAAALGGEFAFAVDGPVLPKPSWKLIIEVYDSTRLQRTLEWAVERLNQIAENHGIRGFSLETEELGGRRYHELRSLDTGLSAHYLFVDGYFLAGASRPLLERALRFRESGMTLPRSKEFAALMPTDREVNFSAMFYQNVGTLLGPLARYMSDAAARMSPDQEQVARALAATSRPSLTVAYGEPERILFVNSSQGGLISSGLESLLRVDGLLRVQELLGRALREESGHDSE